MTTMVAFPTKVSSSNTCRIMNKDFLAGLKSGQASFRSWLLAEGELVRGKGLPPGPVCCGRGLSSLSRLALITDREMKQVRKTRKMMGGDR